MRKSLLITSALGLVSALPTFAMASAAAGSSAAACGSGCFVQLNAKIMNANLQIKNEKGNKSTVDAPLPDTDKGIADQIKDDLINTGKNAEAVTLLDIDFSSAANKGAAIAAIGVYPLSDIDTDAKLDTKVDTEATISRESADVKKAVKDYLRANRSLAQETGLPGTTLVGDVILERARIVGDVEFIFRGAAIPAASAGSAANPLGGAAETLETTVAKLTANEVTSSGRDFRGIKKVFVLSVTNNGTPLEQNALKEKVQKNFGTPAFKTELDTLTVNNSAFAALVSTKKEGNIKFNAQLAERKKLEVFDRRVHHHALAGGVGATAGWWQNMGSFAVSISGSGDYHWGTFRTVDDASGSPMKAEDKRKLGFGFQGDLGVHYVVSPSTTLGVLVGFRGQQLQIGRTDKTKTTTNSKDSKGDYASKWMWNPVVSAQARTFFTDNVYGALTVGYIIPIERDYKLENTNIPNKDAKVRLQGLTGAFSVGMMF